MDNEQPAADSGDIEGRMANLFSQESAPESEPSPAQDQSEQDASGNEGESQETEEQTPEDSGLEEVEFDGKSYQLPKELKDAVLRQKDYTQKTQAISARERVYEERELQQRIRSSFEEQIRPRLAEVQKLESQIEQWRNYDTSGLTTDQKIEVWRGIDHMTAELTSKQREIEKAEDQYKKEILPQLKARAVQAAYQAISQAVPEWKPDSQAEKDVARYMAAQGVSEQVLVNRILADPLYGVNAYKAMKLDQLLSNKTAAIGKAKSAPPVMKPGAAKSPTQQRNAEVGKLRENLKKSGSVKDAEAIFREMFKG